MPIRPSAHAGIHNRRDAGYVGVAVAGSLIMFCGFLGLATDVGMIYFNKGRLQAAADSGAIAAARELDRGNTSLVTSAATYDVTSNGYTNGVNRLVLPQSNSR